MNTNCQFVAYTSKRVTHAQLLAIRAIAEANGLAITRYDGRTGLNNYCATIGDARMACIREEFRRIVGPE